MFNFIIYIYIFISPSNGSTHIQKKINTVNTHTYTRTHTRHTHTQITLISVVIGCTTCLQLHCCSYCSNIYNLTNSQFSSFLERARSKLLGSLKQKCSWHDLMMSMLSVLNNFIKKIYSWNTLCKVVRQQIWGAVVALIPHSSTDPVWVLQW